MDEALKARGVTHAYRSGASSVPVLKDFDFDLKRGEFAALMGPSGSGKSTFLHLAAGLLVPEAGSIVVDGQDVTKMGDTKASKFRRTHVGVVFQAFNLIETLSVRENVVLPAKLNHQRVDERRLRELLEKLSLSGAERKSPLELSGGERQRVAFARALFMKPALLLADEPTGNLDAVSAQRICGLLSALNETESCAILLVTHDPLVAAAATRVDFLSQGRVASSFPTHHEPATISARYLETYGAREAAR